MRNLCLPFIWHIRFRPIGEFARVVGPCQRLPCQSAIHHRQVMEMQCRLWSKLVPGEREVTQPYHLPSFGSCRVIHQGNQGTWGDGRLHRMTVGVEGVKQREMLGKGEVTAPKKEGGADSPPRELKKRHALNGQRMTRPRKTINLRGCYVSSA